MCGTGFHCSLPHCPICGGKAAEYDLSMGRIPMMDYADKYQDVQRLTTRNVTSNLGLYNFSSTEEKKCTCGSGYNRFCPKHGLGI